MERPARQLDLLAPPTWGGRREGAGRKPVRRRASVPHRTREAVSHRQPVHVTLRVRPHVWNLRSRRAFEAIGSTFLRNKARDGFRLVHFTVQGNHLHLIVEARDADHLSRGMIGLSTWIARRLNRMMGCRGKVFADRFHTHILRGPVEVARAIAYVLGNFAVHAGRWAARVASGRSAPPAVSRTAGRPDPYSSDGPDGPALTAPPQTWLLREGYRLGLRPSPAAAPRRR